MGEVWERAIRQPLLAQLNAQIEAQMFEAAMQAGRRLRLDQAMELAVNQQAQDQ